MDNGINSGDNSPWLLALPMALFPVLPGIPLYICHFMLWLGMKVLS